jgi:hypothetical protein
MFTLLALYPRKLTLALWNAAPVYQRAIALIGHQIGRAEGARRRMLSSPLVLSIAVKMRPNRTIGIQDRRRGVELTGNGTDFVVLLSGEPQGGIKIRQRGPAIEFPYARPRDRLPYWRSPVAGPFSSW